MCGLRSRIHAIVRKKTGIRIPTVRSTCTAPFQGRSVRATSQTRGIAKSTVTVTVPAENRSVFQRTA